MARREQAAAAGACEGEPGAVVQRTQVLLLAGEPWGPGGARRTLDSFAQHALGAPGDEAAAAPEQQAGAGAGEAGPCGAVAAPPSGRLTFLLCRAASLRERPERLREALRGVREQGRGPAAALVGVLVQPRADEEPEALRLLEQLLRDTFRDAGPELHTAVFAPGRPGGALELRRLGPRASPPRAVGKLRLDRSLAIQLLGAILSVGTVAYGSYYLYNHPPV